MQYTLKDIIVALLIWVSVAIFGFLLLYYPSIGQMIIRFYLGIIMVIGSALIFYLYFSGEDKALLKFVEAAILGVLGLLFLFIPETSTVFLGVILLIYLIVDGFLAIKEAMLYKKIRLSGWFIFLIYGLLCFGLAIYVFFNLNMAINLLVMLIGIFALVKGIVAIIELFGFKVKQSKILLKE